MSAYQHTQDQDPDPTGHPSTYYTQQQQALGYYQYSDELPPEIYVEGEDSGQPYNYSYGYGEDDDEEEPPTPTASSSRHLRHSKKSSKDKGKGSSTSSGSSKKRKDGKPVTVDSGSDTEREKSNKMSSRSSRHHQSSSSSSKKDKDKGKAKSDDWTEITEPEERRRIQNRIAQRKFREKAREQKDRAQRDAQNQQYASGSYRIPSPSELPQDGGELSGLPWGSMDMRHVISRGHTASSATSSPQGTGSRSTAGVVSGPGNPYFLSPYSAGYAPTATGGYYTSGSTAGDGGSSGDDRYGGTDESSPYYYDYDFDQGV